MIGKLPAAVKFQHTQRGTLLRGEVAERGVRHVVRLQRELVQRRQQLRHRAHLHNNMFHLTKVCSTSIVKATHPECDNINAMITL